LAETQPPYLVFISHSSEDRWIARQMAAIIERKAKRDGVRTFLDEKDLEAGTIIPEEIRPHLESCEEFLLLLTRSRSRANGFCSSSAPLGDWASASPPSLTRWPTTIYLIS
jgi:TIR domain